MLCLSPDIEARAWANLAVFDASLLLLLRVRQCSFIGYTPPFFWPSSASRDLMDLSRLVCASMYSVWISPSRSSPARHMDFACSATFRAFSGSSLAMCTSAILCRAYACPRLCFSPLKMLCASLQAASASSKDLFSMCSSASTSSAAPVSRTSPTSWKIVNASFAFSTALSMSLFIDSAEAATHSARASHLRSQHSWKRVRACSAASTASSNSFETSRGKAWAYQPMASPLRSFSPTKTSVASSATHRPSMPDWAMTWSAESMSIAEPVALLSPRSLKCWTSCSDFEIASSNSCFAA
mmetsp:Transcript_41949/g.108678  ORF Transcript_41949/g.108678 Transcript_41949/m.108678 type:complete len:297 (+) Transcript_41949:930-1820(+)